MNSETKKVIETVCKKCGEQYDRNYKACPNCGFNPFRAFLKAAGITLASLLLIGCFVLSIVNTVTINQINEKINTIGSTVSQSSDEAKAQHLSNYTFYKDYVLYDNAVLDNLGDDYFIYFHQEDCSACLAANQYVLSYYNVPVSSESDEYIFDKKPVYFVTPDTSSDLFNKFNVESTPTMVRMNKSKEIKRAVGTDEVNEMFGEVVNEYYPE